MRRSLPGGYELDDDVARIDVDAVHRYLSDESYWAQGRPREHVQHTIDRAARVVGLYHGGQLVGFARIVSDDVHMAYLCDVFVLEEHRGDGRGVELVREAVEHGPHARLMWCLGTRDAHELYRRFGFAEPDFRWMTRSRQQS